jgi:hypothetical protein
MSEETLRAWLIEYLLDMSPKQRWRMLSDAYDGPPEEKREAIREMMGAFRDLNRHRAALAQEGFH